MFYKKNLLNNQEFCYKEKQNIFLIKNLNKYLT